MDPAVEVELYGAKEIDPSLRAHLRRLFDAEFGSIAYQWAPPEWYASARIGGRSAGGLVIVTREVEAGGTRARVAGIGNVVTLPEYRRMGVATAMLSCAAQLMRDRLAAEFGLLICRHQVAPVYEKSGWKRVGGPTRFRQPSGIVTYPYDTMVLRIGWRQWPDGEIDLRGLPW